MAKRIRRNYGGGEMKNNIPIPLFKNHEKFLSKIRINSESECWEWRGCLTKQGYGIYGLLNGDKYKTHPAHRVSYSIFKGELSEILVLDHVCKNKACVNPEHLREVLHVINVTENSFSPSALNKLKITCKRGHELSKDNVYIQPSRPHTRSCIKCKTIHSNNRKAQRKMELK